jgi:hypothetical protein
LEAVPDDVPQLVRLRRLLKVLLRGYRFRCRRIEELKPEMDDKTSGQTVKIAEL